MTTPPGMSYPWEGDAPDPPSRAFYALIPLGWIAGLIGYFAVRDRHRRMGQRLLFGGIFASVFYASMAVLLGIHFFGPPKLPTLLPPRPSLPPAIKGVGVKVGPPRHPDAVQFRPVQAITEAPQGGTLPCPTYRANPAPSDPTTLCDSARTMSYRLGPAEVTGAGIRSAATSLSPYDRTVLVTINFTPAGQTRLTAMTRRAFQAPPPANQIAIVVGGRVLEAPDVQAVVPGALQISGGADDAKGRKALLDALS